MRKAINQKQNNTTDNLKTNSRNSLVSNQNNSQSTAKAKYVSQSETKRIFSVFDNLQKDSENTKSLFDNQVLDDRKEVLSMASLGQLGRFGNQLFQYAYLRICAERRGAKVECSAWIGQILFGHEDTPITKRLPAAVEIKEQEESLFDVVPEFIPYLEKLASAKSERVGPEILSTGLADVDLWGFFQFHTQYLKPHQQYFRSLFQPVNDLKFALESGLKLLRSEGKTIVGIHLRRGDFLTEPRVGFSLVFPAKWYRQWLEERWEQLESPVLVLCSDDINSVIDEFEQFSPRTMKDLNLELPEKFEDLDLEFYLDFFVLSKCDVVVTSNSSFSFVACMLNEQADMFVRPVWDLSLRFETFDPWNSEPILWLGSKHSPFAKSLLDTLRITYTTQGSCAMLKCLFIYLPLSYIKEWMVRVYLGYQVQGILGIVKSLLCILGYRSAWKTFK